MGIQDLTKLIKTTLMQIDPNDFKGRSITIDTLLMLRTCFHRVTDNIFNSYTTDEKVYGEIEMTRIECETITMMLSKLNFLLRCKIIPLYVFDGDKTPSKSKELESRAYVRAKAEETYSIYTNIYKQSKESDDPSSIELPSHKKVITAKKAVVRPTFEFIEKVKNILRAMDFSVIIAKFEGEKAAAALCPDIAYAAYSRDSDLHAYGCEVVITDIDKGKFNVYKNSKILEDLGFTKQQLLETCIMLGNDHNERILGIGPSTIRNNIKKYHTLENYIISDKKVQDNVEKLNSKSRGEVALPLPQESP